MLEAGADPVLWLVTREPHLAVGARALADRLGPQGLTVCESNSLRQVVTPGLFVVVQRAGDSHVKRSCRRVWDLADAVVTFDGERHHPGPEAFSIVHGRWALHREATAIVLAGGKSRRMGRDKALLEVDGVPMIKRVVDQLRPHFAEILVSANDPERYAFLGLEVVPDSEPGLGPMVAIASTLARARYETCFAVPCDMPDLPVPLMTRLLRLARRGADVVVPRTHDGHYEPLFAVYRRRLRPLMEAKLAAGVRQLFAFYGECDTVEVPLSGDEGLRNVNTRDEYEALLREGGP